MVSASNEFSYSYATLSMYQPFLWHLFFRKTPTKRRFKKCLSLSVNSLITRSPYFDVSNSAIRFNLGIITTCQSRTHSFQCGPQKRSKTCIKCDAKLQLYFRKTIKSIAASFPSTYYCSDDVSVRKVSHVNYFNGRYPMMLKNVLLLRFFRTCYGFS